MGSWAYGPFDNDSAQDWVASLKSPKMLARELRKALKSKSPEEIRAAAATIKSSYEAHLLGDDDAQSLALLAIKALQKLAESEWVNEWKNKQSLLRNLRSQIRGLETLHDEVG